jgi:DNA modification methylase
VNIIEFGDCRETMRRWAEQGVKAQTCVTSPPYFGLRDYGHDGQLGLEKTPDAYIKAMVEVFRCVRDVLADDGTLWLNIGDSYCGTGSKGDWVDPKNPNGRSGQAVSKTQKVQGCKSKDLIGIPWMLAFALRADGWYLRQDIIWHKPNPMPEPVQDRCTKAHEYIFLLSKSQKYYFDNESIAEPLASASIARLSQANLENQKGSDRVPGKTNGNMKAVYCGSDKPYTGKSTKDYGAGGAQDASATKARIVDRILSGEITTRNKRSVWTVTTKPYKGAHFATFPPDLITPCILAGSMAGDIVLDPFMGSGTTAAVALQHGRQYLGCELNPEYGPLQQNRIDVYRSLFDAP